MWVNGHRRGASRRASRPSFRRDGPPGGGGECARRPCAGRHALAPEARGKQCPDYHSRGCFLHPYHGDLADGVAEAVPQSYIRPLRLTPDLENCRVTHRGRAWPGARARHAAAPCGPGRPGGEGRGPGALCWASVRWRCCRVQVVQAWAPGQPTLYDLHLTLSTTDGCRDAGAAPIRAAVAGAVRERAILLNGQPVFQRLVLDQGFYPDGIYTAPRTTPRCASDITLSQAMGFNGARLHQKVFEPRPLLGRPHGLPGVGRDGRLGHGRQRPGSRKFPAPVAGTRASRHNHPALVLWTPFNETQRGPGRRGAAHGLPCHEGGRRRPGRSSTPAATNTSRPISMTSTTTSRIVATFAARYARSGPGASRFRNRPGGRPLRGPALLRQRVRRDLVEPRPERRQGLGLRAACAAPRCEASSWPVTTASRRRCCSHPRICGFCYTQLTDVEQEVNGLYTYDRQPKFDPAVHPRHQRPESSGRGLKWKRAAHGPLAGLAGHSVVLKVAALHLPQTANSQLVTRNK